jgi:hypothetical protein
MGMSCSFWFAWGIETHLALEAADTLWTIDGIEWLFVFVEEVVLYAGDIQIALLYLGSKEGALGDFALLGVGRRKSWSIVHVD